MTTDIEKDSAEKSRYSHVATKVSVFRNSENPIYGDGVTSIEIEDEGAGPFLKLHQSEEYLGNGAVRLDIDELRFIAAVADEMVANYKKEIDRYK